jgi:predicted O-methyltransferase YrrM
MFLHAGYKREIMYKEPKVYSSYSENNIGQTLYDIVMKLKPKKIIEIGVLEGYSTICMAQALKDLGDRSAKVYAHDLFDEYEYRNCSMTKVWNNLNKYEVQDYVQLKLMSFDRWLNSMEDFDLMHIDISNNGDVIKKLYDRLTQNKSIKTGPIFFEGGTQERDKVDWMVEYNKNGMYPLKDELSYDIVDSRFPGLSVL